MIVTMTAASATAIASPRPQDQEATTNPELGAEEKSQYDWPSGVRVRIVVLIASMAFIPQVQPHTQTAQLTS